MKNQFIFTLALCFFSSAIISQTLDNQWLVLDNKGKSGYDSGRRENIFSGPLNTRNILLNGIAHVRMAESGQPQLCRNDVFVIYDDGHYFNSRDYNALNYIPDFFQPAPGHESDLVHNLQSLHSSNIQALYLTNIYEEDDYPPAVRAASGSQPNLPVVSFLNSIPARTMTANHDVVMNKDITLIIRNSGAVAETDTLIINNIIVGAGTVMQGNYFNTSRVFSNRSQFSNVPQVEDLGNGKIVLKGFTTNNPPNIFINLRPTESLNQFVGSAKANFMIKPRNPTMPFTFLEESVLSAHDPNYLQVVSTCEKGDGEKYVYYHIEFENDGRVQAENVKVIFQLPDYFYQRCIREPKFYIAGEEVMGKMSRFRRHVRFVFDKDEVVIPCTSSDKTICSGYVEFCVRISEDKDLTDLATDLELIEAKVKFGHQAELITEFEDLEWVDDPNNPGSSKRPDPDSSCSCSCPAN